MSQVERVDCVGIAGSYCKKTPCVVLSEVGSYSF